MRISTLMTRSRVPGYAFAASLCASAAAAQGNAPPPQAADTAGMAPTPAPTSPPPSADALAPAAPPPAPPAGAPPAPSTPPPPAAGANTPPAAPPPGYVAQPDYPPPPYARLGGQPEPEIENGTWDPWAHPATGRFEHEGFFLRLDLGPSYSTLSRPDYRWTGLGLGLGLAIGGSLVENFALHADFQTTLLPSPAQHAYGHKTDFNADIVFESMGIGATWHIMPANIFISGSAGIGVLVFEADDGQSKDTSAGLTLNGLIGKEWWVGADWGIGFAGQVLFMNVKDYVDEQHINAFAFNLLFTATYN